MKVLVSACLLGRNCKYNGGNNYSARVMEYLRDKEVVPVCPEVAAGLGVPRIPVEIRGGVVTDREGRSVDAPLRRAVADIVAGLAGRQIGCAVLKSRSPTCGVRQVYDGSFTGRLVDGSGILAQALAEAGIPVIDAEDI